VDGVPLLKNCRLSAAQRGNSEEILDNLKYLLLIALSKHSLDFEYFECGRSSGATASPHFLLSVSLGSQDS
jgi:hypothetical protein